MLLRHRDVELAILETARGGLLRRGLTVERARAAVVTNVADDHLGEFGVDDLQGLAATKLLVSRALGADGAVVLNADDALLRAGAREIQSPVAWFSLNPENPEVLDANGNAPRAVLEQGSLVLREGGSRTVVVSVEDLPIAMGGAARHNIANALAAMAAASLLRITPSEMRQALRTFGVSGADNPGRGAVLEIGGVRVIVDFAHNPHGMAALIEASRTQAGARRLLLVGQAGDRGDEAIRDLARAAMAFRPDRVVVKELDAYLRGRQPGEVPALLADEFSRLGMPASAISSPGSELAAVRDALAWARPGDLLLLTVHQDLPAVLALFEALRTANWRAGNPLP
jgi:cyanophycin synthetase